MKKYQKLFFFTTAFIGALLVLASCATPTPVVQEVTREVQVTVQVPVEVTRIVEVTPAVEVPYQALWEGSGHNAVDTEAFRHWDADGEVPTSCAKCHSSAGYEDFIGADGSEASKVDAAVPAADAQGIQCTACHNTVATAMASVGFPGKDGEGNQIVIDGLGDAARCMQCHQGRESKASVDGVIARFKVEDMDAVVPKLIEVNAGTTTTSTFGFRNIHYFAAAATLYGSQVKGGYEYDGKIYDWKNAHVDGYDTCVGCHDPHSLEVKVEECAECHEGVATVEDLKNARIAQASAWDYDGDGNLEEGMYYEIQGLQEVLLAEIQKYALAKGGAEIKYDGATYPYFMGADGKAYPAWTARLLKAAYNYQVSIKDPGSFAHGNKYIVQLLFDSIEDLGGDVSKFVRNDAGHFAGNTMPFRDWDDSATGEVPYRCAKCHSATGLPTFIKNNGTVVYTVSGTTTTAGVGAQPISNGFMCVTCHNAAEFPALYSVVSVPFPSGAVVGFEKDAEGKFVANNSNLCIECHQGRESANSMDAALRGKEADTVDKNVTVKSIHYFVAGATLFGDVAKGLYQYSGKSYNGQFMHGDLGPTQCAECHNVHALEVEVEKCAECHKTVKTVEDLATIRAKDNPDFDGDGDAAEGIKGEIDGMAGSLLAAIQTYAAEKAGAIIVFENNNFYLDKDGDGKADRNPDTNARVSYNGNWTPRLTKAAFNFRYVMVNDPGAFTHNGQYVLQALYDSIEDLGGDVSKMTRPEAPAK